MPYIFIAKTEVTDCECGLPVKRISKRYPEGSVWACPHCGSQWIKERVEGGKTGQGAWHKLTTDEMLTYNSETDEWCE